MPFVEGAGARTMAWLDRLPSLICLELIYGLLGAYILEFSQGPSDISDAKHRLKPPTSCFLHPDLASQAAAGGCGLVHAPDTQPLLRGRRLVCPGGVFGAHDKDSRSPAKLSWNLPKLGGTFLGSHIIRESYCLGRNSGSRIFVNPLLSSQRDRWLDIPCKPPSNLMN